jgi:hypothetical protein
MRVCATIEKALILESLHKYLLELLNTEFYKLTSQAGHEPLGY